MEERMDGALYLMAIIIPFPLDIIPLINLLAILSK